MSRRRFATNSVIDYIVFLPVSFKDINEGMAIKQIRKSRYKLKSAGVACYLSRNSTDS